MDCLRCRSLFSDRLDGSAAPDPLEDMDAHLAGCASCRRELRQVEKALDLLRSAEREEPPAGLAGAILASAAVGRAPLRSWGVLLHGVAALVILSLLGILLIRETSWRRTLGRLESTIADARFDRTRLEKEVSALQGQVDLFSQKLDAAGRERQELESKLARAESHSAELEGRLADARESHRKEIASLREDLAASRSEMQRLALELGEIRSAPAGIPVPAEIEPDARRPQGAVHFVDRGDRIELRARGSRQAVMTELFQIAADESNPDLANLALTALENYLAGDAAAARAAPGGAADPGTWLSRGVENLAQGLGIREAPQAESAPDRRRRLKDLESVWRRQPSNGEE